MKKFVLLFALLILFTGCEIKDLKDEDIDKLLIDTLSERVQDSNKYFEGYKYYLPRGFSLVNKKGNNHILLSNGDYYYLYVDVVSYFHKKKDNVVKDNDLYFFKKINYNNIDGYIKVGNPEEDVYFVEVGYNYGRIEAYIKKENLATSIRSVIKLLASIQYNDVILDTIVGEKTLDYHEEVFSTYESKRDDGTFLEYIEEYDTYEEEKDVTKDEDVLDTTSEEDYLWDY